MSIQIENEVIFPNESVILSQKYVDFVRQYMYFAKQSAENIIKLAKTLVKAKSGLTEREFGQFCNEVGLDPKSSTFRKLKAIGDKVARFEPFVERIPSNWTTVYKLATLECDAFDRVMKSDQLSPLMTAQDVDLILSEAPPITGHHHRDLIIDLSGLEQPAKISAYQEIRKLEQQFGFGVTVSKDFTKAIKSSGVPAALLPIVKQPSRSLQ